jgi:hypothetical protein
MHGAEITYRVPDVLGSCVDQDFLADRSHLFSCLRSSSGIYISWGGKPRTGERSR